MIKNGGIIGPQNIPSQTSGTGYAPVSLSGVFDSFQSYNHVKQATWPQTIRANWTSVSSYTPSEGVAFTTKINLSGAISGLTLHYSIIGISGDINAADFYDGLLQGTFITYSEWGTTSSGEFSKTLVTSDGTETESFTIQIRLTNSSGPLLATTNTVTPVDSFYTPSSYPTVTATSPSAFSYLAMPGGSRTFLNYIASFGVIGTSSNTGSATWIASYSGNLAYTASPIATNNYFTLYNRVRFIDGDGGADSSDWAVINFGIANASGDFDGQSGTYQFFGGEASASGGAGNVGVTIGRIWGFSASLGWTLLYQLPLGSGSGSLYTHTNGSWFTSGTTVSTGNGKRSEYNTLTITHVGFSVGTS